MPSKPLLWEQPIAPQPRITSWHARKARKSKLAMESFLFLLGNAETAKTFLSERFAESQKASPPSLHSASPLPSPLLPSQSRSGVSTFFCSQPSRSHRAKTSTLFLLCLRCDLPGQIVGIINSDCRFREYNFFLPSRDSLLLRWLFRKVLYLFSGWRFNEIESVSNYILWWWFFLSLPLAPSPGPVYTIEER